MVAVQMVDPVPQNSVCSCYPFGKDRASKKGSNWQQKEFYLDVSNNFFY